MRGRDGSTMLELLTVLAIAGVLATVAVPGAARVRSTFAGAEGARRLALVLRAAQAEAQSRSGPVRVEVGAGGEYTVTAAVGNILMTGRLGTQVTSTYPGGVLEFTERGWARIPGSTSPRAGHFDLAGATSSSTVVVQLSGCVRCT